MPNPFVVFSNLPKSLEMGAGRAGAGGGVAAAAGAYRMAEGRLSGGGGGTARTPPDQVT
jgi:hypothetical protein